MNGRDFFVSNDQIADLSPNDRPPLFEGESITISLPVEEYELSFGLQGIASGSFAQHYTAPHKSSADRIGQYHNDAGHFPVRQPPGRDRTRLAIAGSVPEPRRK